METLGQIHSRLTYVKGSLRNIDLNSDEVFDAFSFDFQNPPVPLGGLVIRMEILVDRKKVPSDRILLITNFRARRLSELSEDAPLECPPYEGMKFVVLQEGGLSEGEHEVTIKSWLEGFQEIWMSLSFKDMVGRVTLPMVKGERDLGYPIVLANKVAYCILSRSGDLCANWNWMGVSYDNGGLYVPPAKCTGKIALLLSLDNRKVRLVDLPTRFEIGPGVLHVLHRDPDASLEIHREVFMPLRTKSVILKLTLANNGPREINGDLIAMTDARITSYGLLAVSPQNFSLHFDKTLSAIVATTPDLRYVSIIGSDRSFHARLRDITLHEGDSLTTSEPLMELAFPFTLRPKGTDSCIIVIAGSQESFDTAAQDFLRAVKEHETLLEELKAYYTAWLADTVSIETPDFELDLAFALSKVALDYLKLEHHETGVGVCAGLPRFPNFWGRDTGWALRAYLSISDYDFSKVVLENFLGSQAKEDNAHLNATKGEIPMVISGRSFLHQTSYGAADATLHFPILVWEYVRRTGDRMFLRKWEQTIIDMVEWGYRKDTDGDTLIEHGAGRAGELFPLPDTTWMDHIDRRKSANDVQALWAAALYSTSLLMGISGCKKLSDKFSQDYTKVKTILQTMYWNEAYSYFYDTLRPDGSLSPDIRPNAMVILLAKLATAEQAEKALSRIEKTDMTTDWGVRTLSSEDPTYSPKAYLSGQVWPLVTGWTAMAEFSYEKNEQGFSYLKKMVKRIIEEAGMYAELYRGDDPKPFNSCILQAWSVAMFVYCVVDYLFGCVPDAIDGKLYVRSRLPSGWNWASIKGVRVGKNVMDLVFDLAGNTLKAINKGKEELTIVTAAEQTKVGAFSEVKLRLK